MKKVLAFALFVLAFGLIKSTPVQAFTLGEMCGSASVGDICKTSADPQIQECCKCHAPCIPSGSGPPTFNPAFLNCFTKKEKCPSDCTPPPIPSECKVDADCKEKDNDPCTKPMCQLMAIDGICANGEHWGTIIGKCHEVPVPGCGPKDCGTKYPGNKFEQRCCLNGYDPAVSKPLWDCCVANLSATPPKPHDAPCCPRPGECPPPDRCPPPPPLDCSIFKDAGTKACCEKFKNFPPVMVIDKCVKPGECNNSINIVAEAGATVNLSNFNQCCQYITNPGSIADSTISQICNNITTTPTTPPPGTPGTTPAGAPTTGDASCSLEPMSPNDVLPDGRVVGISKGREPVAYRLRMKAPGTTGVPAMTTATNVVVQQVAGSNSWSVTAGEAATGFAGPRAIVTKDFASMGPESVVEPVYAPGVAAVIGTPDQRGEFEVQWTDLTGTIVASTRCIAQPYLHSEGSGGGCSLLRH